MQIRNVIWSCPFDVSGYSQMGQSLALALSRNGYKVRFEAQTVSLSLKDSGLNDREKIDSLRTTQVDEPYIRVNMTVPDRFLRDRSAKINVGYTLVETDFVSKHWVACCNQMDGILTSTEFSRRSLINSGVSVPVAVMPHCHTPDQFTTKRYSIRGLRDCNFLFVADLTPRKGWDKLIQAYCEAFDETSPVTLTLKVYNHDFSPESQERCKSLIRKAIVDTGKIPNVNTAPIYFYGHCLPNTCVQRFINSFECIVSPHSGEGWGLICSQAMLLGKPVIATNYSGNLDFMNEKNSYLVSASERVPIPDEMVQINSTYAGQTWPVISVPELGDTLKRVAASPYDRITIGSKARKTIEDNYTELNAARAFAAGIKASSEKKIWLI
jgi:glycosyltransferase involved in cell wall biosynthesis